MAKFNFVDLEEEIRLLMLTEIKEDIEKGSLYISDRLNEKGKEKYSDFFIEATTNGDEESFEKLLERETYFNPTYLRFGNPVKMPSNASTLLCQSEFNRYYIRAVCLKTISHNINEVEIYRARDSSSARSGSELRIGEFILANELLEDLRSCIGSEPKLFPEINSGLCVKLSMANDPF